MPNTVPDILPPTSPRRSLSREIAAALLVKFVLLWGLWHFAIRPGKPVVKPDIAEIFRSPQASMPIQPQENPHAIRR